MDEKKGKKGKKGKGKKITLQEFVEQSGGGTQAGVTQVQVPTKFSWADECDDIDDGPTQIIELPTAPRSARLLSENLVPEQPPFIAYLSNLPFDINEDDVTEFFVNLRITSIRLPRDDEGTRLRGYGYVEFETREDLIDAVSIPDPQIRTRRIRIDLSSGDNDRRGNRSGGRFGGDYGAGGNWRENRGDNGFSSNRDGGDRDGGRRGYGGGGDRYRTRDYESRIDRPGDGEAGSWRTGDRPAYSPPATRRGGFGDRDRGGGGGFGDRDRDRFGGGRRRPFGDEEGPLPGGDTPAERPKLNLQPRTLPMPKLEFPKEEEVAPPQAPLSPRRGAQENGDTHHHDGDGDEGGEKKEGEDQAPPPPKPRGVPSAKVFGDAKPVDTAAKEREFEERLREREAKQREEEERVKREREETAVAPKTEVEQQQQYDDDGETKHGDDNEPPAAATPAEEPAAPKAADMGSWRKKDSDDERPRLHSYSPERDGRGGPPRRGAPGRFKDRGYRDGQGGSGAGSYREGGERKYGRDFRRREGVGSSSGGGGSYGDKERPSYRGGQGAGGAGVRRDRDERRDNRSIEERMPKFKPTEGPNLSVSNPFAGLEDEQEDQE